MKTSTISKNSIISQWASIIMIIIGASFFMFSYYSLIESADEDAGVVSVIEKEEEDNAVSESGLLNIDTFKNEEYQTLKDNTPAEGGYEVGKKNPFKK